LYGLGGAELAEAAIGGSNTATAAKSITIAFFTNIPPGFSFILA
jgi:hypothetical protein